MCYSLKIISTNTSFLDTKSYHYFWFKGKVCELLNMQKVLIPMFKRQPKLIESRLSGKVITLMLTDTFQAVFLLLVV